MRAAIFQSDTAGLTPDQRLERLRRAATGLRADLLLCPELFLSGYAVGPALPELAEPMAGPFAAAVAAIARESGVAIAYGYPERAGGRLYNAAQCIGPDGRRLANHRKLTVAPGFEADYFTPGAGPTLFVLGGVTLALLVCYDVEFPETVRAMAEAGAQAVLVPTALASKWEVVARLLVPVRAFENGLHLLYANHAGREGAVEYLGASCIVGPDGRDLARAGPEETLLVAELDLAGNAAARARVPFLRDLAGLRARLAARPEAPPEPA